jgi:hypothetical protein
MCIILTGKKSQITKTEITQGFITNPDGWGIWSEKTLQKPHKGYKLNSLLNLFDSVKANENCVIWCRISTGGSTLQPFAIGGGRYLFHNGICGKSKGNKSDTAILAENIHGLPECTQVNILKAYNAKNKGKFCVTRPKGEPIIIGFKADKDGIARSNDNHLNKPTKWNANGYQYALNHYDD